MAAEVTHPAPKTPHFLSESWYESLKAQIPPPPSGRDRQQKQDVGELQTLQKIRTQVECERAKAEVFVNLDSFFGPPNGPLSAEKVERLASFFEQVRNDGDFFIQRLKKDFPRPRPYHYIRKLKPCIDREVTGAYPSGHAALSRLYARILSDLYPDQKAAFEKRAKQIGSNRILSGMHHRSDVDAGKQVGDLVYAELQKSEPFKAEVAKLSGASIAP